MKLALSIAFALAFTSTSFGSGCEMTTSYPEVDTGIGIAGAPRYYVDYDQCQPCMWSLYVYEESNGIDGLQRGDEVVDDTCAGAAGPSDTIVF
jgi:hypothetical protein